MGERKWSMNVVGSHCGQPLEGRSDAEEKAILSCDTTPHTQYTEGAYSLCYLSRPGLDKQAGPPTHLCRAPVVRGIVEWSRDGCLRREGRVLALHWRRMLVAIAPIVIASCVSKMH